MDNRLALIGIIVEDLSSSDSINAILHEFGGYIVGRMGIPYRQRSVSIISVVVDAPNDIINAMTGKIGKIKGVNVKAQYAKL